MEIIAATGLLKWKVACENPIAMSGLLSFFDGQF
jgi:hypothetical protein